MSEDTPQLPEISVVEIERCYLAVRSILETWSGYKVDGAILDYVHPRIKAKLCRKGESYAAKEFGALDGDEGAALKQTLVRLIGGQKLDGRLLASTCSLLAGNLDKVRAGLVLSPWQSQAFTEWVLLSVLEARAGRRFDQGGAYYTLRVLSGSPAGVKFVQFFNSTLIDRMASRMGVKGRFDDRYLHPAELVQCLFMGNLKVGDILEISEYEVKGSLTKRNSELTRKRGQDRKCPLNHKWPCFKCVVGYSQCELGTRPASLERRACGTVCGESRNGWFDPRYPEAACLGCPNKERVRKNSGGHGSGYKAGIARRNAFAAGRAARGGEESTGEQLSAEGQQAVRIPPAVAESGQGPGHHVADVSDQGPAAG